MMRLVFVRAAALLLILGCGDAGDAGQGAMPVLGVPPPASPPVTTPPPAPVVAGQGGSATEPVAPPPAQPAAPVPMDGAQPPPAQPADGAMDDGAMDDGMGDGAMDDGAMSGSMPGGDAPTRTGPPGTLTIELTTVSYGGEYAPQNYVAVWIEDASGAFVKTVQRSAGAIHAGDLTAWTAASGGWSFFSPSSDQTDAISSATLSSHQSHAITWNLQDANGAPVADGNYAVMLEMTESRARTRNGPVARIDFVKGPSAQTVEHPDDASFVDVVIHFEP